MSAASDKATKTYYAEMLVHWRVKVIRKFLGIQKLLPTPFLKGVQCN